MLCKTLIFMAFMSLFSACTTVSTKPNPSKSYKMDLYMESDDRSGNGTLVLPKKDDYSIYLEADAKINYLVFRTCSREITVEDPRSGLSRKKFTIRYTPNEIEREGVCPSEVMALNINGQNGVGFIEYEDPQTTLHATNICGGVTELVNGVSICQERVNMVEKIKFDVEVMTSSLCCKLDKESGVEFTYSVPLGKCTIAFIEKKSPNRIHRHVVIGYEEQLITL